MNEFINKNRTRIQTISELWPSPDDHNQAVKRDFKAANNDGPSLPLDQAQVTASWEEKANLGHAPSADRLGWAYYYGLGVPQDRDRAYKLWEKSLLNGYTPAYYSLGIAYFLGLGVNVNKTKALELWGQGAQLGDLGSLFSLGQVYERGEDAPEDIELATKYYAKTSQNGTPTMEGPLGTILNPLNQLPDRVKALDHWKRSAQKAFPRAIILYVDDNSKSESQSDLSEEGFGRSGPLYNNKLTLPNNDILAFRNQLSYAFRRKSGGPGRVKDILAPPVAKGLRTIQINEDIKKSRRRSSRCVMAGYRR
ncbi:MAG: sel1 repeat family protein [Deltaproteobacteria bacterium]|jgi:hypothetical protein|nr:sel1 repeat family protein [Deltaproteobacteria bacterium]